MKKYFLFILFPLFFSCQKEKDQKKQNAPKPELHIVQKHETIIGLEKEAKKGIAQWNEHEALSLFLKKFSSISANEAINNAVELAKLVTALKNNIKPKELETPSFKARVHVLENEVLRLKDMGLITAITAKEVNIEVEKIITAFTATNSKINTVYSQIELNKEIKIDSSFIYINNNNQKN